MFEVWNFCRRRCWYSNTRYGASIVRIQLIYLSFGTWRDGSPFLLDAKEYLWIKLNSAHGTRCIHFCSTVRASDIQKRNAMIIDTSAVQLGGCWENCQYWLIIDWRMKKGREANIERKSGMVYNYSSALNVTSTTQSNSISRYSEQDDTYINDIHKIFKGSEFNRKCVSLKKKI